MTRSRQTNRDSTHASDSSEDDDKSPTRGRSSRSLHNAVSNEQMADEQVKQQMDAVMTENSKTSGA